MRPGLKIIQLPTGGYYPVTYIGWLRRANGDEWELHNACAILRTGAWDLGALDRIAAEGPGKTHKLSKPAKLPLEPHRLYIMVPRVADPAKWPMVPKPADWLE